MARSRARPWAVLVVLVVGLLAPALVPGMGPARAQVGEAAVDIVDFAFEPATLEIPVGTTVTWTNQGQAPHTATAEDGSFDSGPLDPGGTFSHTFEEPGTYAYFCGIHPDMRATIVVTEGEAAEPAEDEADEPAEDQADEGAAETAPPATAEAGATEEGEAAAGGALHLSTVDEPRVAHIHAGACTDLGIVVYGLSDLRDYRVDAPTERAPQPVEMIVGTANVALADLFTEPFSLHVHQSAANKQNYVACSDIGERPPEPWQEAQGLALTLQEQGGSGYAGIASLLPDANGATTVNLFLAQAPAPEEPVTPEPTPPPGTTYTSPTYGYTVTYNPSWTVSQETSSGGRDSLVLNNGTSYVTIDGLEGFDGDPARCVESIVQERTADPNVSNLELVDSGGTEATGNYAIYNHDYTFPNRVESYTLFVGCIPLVPGEAVIAVIQNVPTADYNDQIDDREALLRGLALPQ